MISNEQELEARESARQIGALKDRTLMEQARWELNNKIIEFKANGFSKEYIDFFSAIAEDELCSRSSKASLSKNI